MEAGPRQRGKAVGFTMPPDGTTIQVTEGTRGVRLVGTVILAAIGIVATVRELVDGHAALGVLILVVAAVVVTVSARNALAGGSIDSTGLTVRGVIAPRRHWAWEEIAGFRRHTGWGPRVVADLRAGGEAPVSSYLGPSDASQRRADALVRALEARRLTAVAASPPG
jgi:hypothetical protein